VPAGTTPRCPRNRTAALALPDAGGTWRGLRNAGPIASAGPADRSGDGTAG
jgi:hypothetical protein